MKPFWEITPDEVEKCLKATTWYPAMTEYFRGGGFSSTFLTRGGMPVTMYRINLVKGLGPVLQLVEGWTVDLPEKVSQHHQRAHQSHLANPLVRPTVDGQRTVQGRLFSHGKLGCEPWRDRLWAYCLRPDHAGLHAAHPSEHV